MAPKNDSAPSSGKKKVPSKSKSSSDKGPSASKTKNLKKAVSLAKKSSPIAKKTDQKPGSASSKRVTAKKSVRDEVRVVAIGASAGGLEPFEQFFDGMTVDSGLAFVVIQHLSPDFRSMMDELLNRHSAMKISRVEAGMILEPNTIYLNPPRVDMAIRDGKFVLKTLKSRTTLHLPINVFMESLAEEQGKNSIAIILSGTGSDGTVGATAIREAGGTVLVQDPTTAKFDGMPTSVLDVLRADAIASPKQLSLLVSRLANGEPLNVPSIEEETEPKDRVFQMLRDRFGTDFSHYKNATIERRLIRRAELLGLSELSDYVKKIEQDDEEAEALYADFLIEVTEFFRDKQAFEALEKQVIPKLVKSMSAERPVRIWIPGCASGEEAYSIAICLAEEARRTNVTLNVKILATDIHHRSLESANLGVYSPAAVKKLTPEYLERYFEKVGSNYQIRTFLRQMVVFSVHNILRDPPFTKIDLVSCRNLLIYLNDTAQQKALAYFHFSLVKGGDLFLGPSETVGELSSEFELIDQRWRIFVKRRNVRLIESMTQLPRGRRDSAAQPAPMSSVGGDTTIVRGDAKRVYDRALDLVLKKYAPPGFLLKRSGEVVRVFGDAGKYVEIAEGNFSQRLDDLIRADLRVVVSAALDRAKTPQVLPFERKVRSRVTDGRQSSMTIILEPVNDKRNESDLLLLTINEEARSIRVPDLDELDVQEEDLETVTLLRQRIEDLEHELQGSEETLQTTIEELETSNEELQATNEELMASNEELQSTNEELHSVNEELYTVSAEHQRKIIELTEMSGDMEHLLQATEIGTIFVDSDLNVRRFTPAAVQAFNILDQDVGRPISHITNRFGDTKLTETLSQVIQSGEAAEQEVTLGDSVLLLRALPYVAALGEVSGAVVTTVDVSELKRAQTDAQKLAARYEGIVQDIGHFMLRWRADDEKITFCNDAYVELKGLPREQIIGRPRNALISRDNNEAFISQLARIKPGEAESFLINAGEIGGRTVWHEGTVRAIGDADGVLTEFHVVGQDITETTAYRIALEKLSGIPYEADKSYDEGLSELLAIGSEFFGMPMGVFAEIGDQQYRVKSLIGGEHFGFTFETVLPLNKTYSAGLIDSQKPMVVEHASASGYEKSDAYQNTGIESFIGQTIFVNAKSYGAVSFAARVPRVTPFSQLELSMIGILAEWIGRRVERNQSMQTIERITSDLDLILDNVRTKIWFKDFDNTILNLSAMAAEAMGTTVAKAVGENMGKFFPDTADAIHKADLQIVKSGKPLRDSIEEFAPKDAPKIWVRTDKIPYADPVTDEGRLLIVSNDITSLREQEQRVYELNEELSHKNDRLLTINDGLKQFAHVASHDLQEPLRKLMQFTEYLEQDCGDELSKDGQYFVSVISSSAERMRRLVRDILSLSGASGNEMVPEAIDLSGLVGDLRSEFDVTISESGASFKVGKLPKITGDPTLVEQLFKNLISNALKYRHPDVKPKIEIKSVAKGGRVEVSVSDNGIGLDVENVDQIFDPFTRLHDRKEFDGTGIGLAICRTVCDRHGWHIHVESREKEGTTFKVSIPSTS